MITALCIFIFLRHLNYTCNLYIEKINMYTSLLYDCIGVYLGLLKCIRLTWIHVDLLDIFFFFTNKNT